MSQSQIEDRNMRRNGGGVHTRQGNAGGGIKKKFKLKGPGDEREKLKSSRRMY
jgi:hypothetical protein